MTLFYIKNPRPTSSTRPLHIEFDGRVERQNLTLNYLLLFVTAIQRDKLVPFSDCHIEFHMKQRRRNQVQST